MNNLSTLGAFVMGGGGLLASLIALYMARPNRNKLEADTGKTQAEEKEIETRAAKVSEETYQSREKFWNAQVQQVKEECHQEVSQLRREVGYLKALIEQHVPWDWETQRLLIQNGIDHPKPPTLNYIPGEIPKLEGFSAK